MSGLLWDWVARLASATLQGTLALLVALTICLVLPKLAPHIKVWAIRLALLKLLAGAVFVGGFALLIPPRPQAYIAPPTIFSESVGSLLMIAFLLWNVSVILGIWRHFRNRGKLWSLVHCSEMIHDREILERYRQVCIRMKLKHPPSLRAHPGLTSPLLVQNGVTTILLPESLVSSDDHSRLEVALAHELAHHRHHDLRWGWLVAVSDILFFFLPFVGMALRKLRLYEECAADAAAMKATGDCPSTYSRTLLSFAETTLRVAGAYAMAEDALELDTRIKALYQNRKSPRRLQFAAFVALAVASLALVPWTVRTEPTRRQGLGRIVAISPAAIAEPR